MDWYEVPAGVLVSGHPLPKHISLEPCDSLLAFLRTETSTGQYEEDGRPCLSESVRKPGRRVSKENATLRKFVRDQEGTPQPPKLENMRYRVMRTLKKVLRRMAAGKSAGSRGLLQFQYGNGLGAHWYSQMQEFTMNHQRSVLRFAELQNGPKVDQSKASGTSNFSTYNNPYMDHVFTSYEIRVIYRLFVNLLFSDERPLSLNQRFKILCCPKSSHNEECIEKWAEFRTMMEDYLGAHIQSPDERIPELTLPPSPPSLNP